ncbi:SIS domain-containing protein [Alphaproteobacteria bacterium]|nr:SIS domain-containing protein [Alphaproteobacteria bacterium]
MVLLLKDYYREITDLMVDAKVFDQLELIKQKIIRMNDVGGKLLLAGNGGSAGIVAHAAVDFTKQAGVTALTFNEPGLITAFSNDFGYELWVEKAFEYYSKPEDILICVSVSGESKNLVNAASKASAKGHYVVSFTGKNRDNSLGKIADTNLFVNSKSYNIVEGIHMIWLTSIVDMIIGQSVYEVS